MDLEANGIAFNQGLYDGYVELSEDRSDAWLGAEGQPPVSFTDMQSRKAVRAAFVNADGREVPADNLRIVLRARS